MWGGVGGGVDEILKTQGGEKCEYSRFRQGDRGRNKEKSLIVISSRKLRLIRKYKLLWIITQLVLKRKTTTSREINITLYFWSQNRNYG